MISREREIIHRQFGKNIQFQPKKFCRGGFTGQAKLDAAIFVSKISADGVFCFSQDLCPRMALYRRLWA